MELSLVAQLVIDAMAHTPGLDALRIDGYHVEVITCMNDKIKIELGITRQNPPATGTVDAVLLPRRDGEYVVMIEAWTLRALRDPFNEWQVRDLERPVRRRRPVARGADEHEVIN